MNCRPACVSGTKAYKRCERPSSVADVPDSRAALDVGEAVRRSKTGTGACLASKDFSGLCRGEIECIARQSAHSRADRRKTALPLREQGSGRPMTSRGREPRESPLDWKMSLLRHRWRSTPV